MVQISDEILGWFWGLAHWRKRVCEGQAWKLLTHLKAWAAAATPMSVPSSSFGRRQRAASFLSSFWVEIFQIKWEPPGNLDPKAGLPQTPAQSQFSAFHPELCEIWIWNGGNLSTLKKVVGSSVPLSIVRGAWSSSEDCWGTSCWKGKNLGMVCLFVCLFHPQSPPLCLFFMEFCVPSYRVRWPYQTFTRVRVREGDKMEFFATRIVD